MKYLIQIWAVIFTLLSLIGCNQKSKNNSSNSESDLVTYFTRGEISNSEDIIIKLDNSTEIKELTQEELDNLFSFSPKIEGHAERLSAVEFTFIPDRRLSFNTEYTGNFKVGTLIEGSDIDDFEFTFKTRQLRFNVTTKAFNSYSKDYGKFRTRISVNDYVSISQLKSILKVDSKIGRDYSFSKPDDFVWKEFTGVLDSVKREADDIEYTLSYDASKLDSESEGEYSVTVPGKNRFRILNVEVITNNSQEIVVNFSDPLLPDQNFDGLIKLNNVNNLTYSISGSQLKIFPNKRIKTKKEFTILKAIKSNENYSLKNDWLSEVVFEQLKPEVKLLASNATILPNSSGLKVNFTTRKLKGVSVKVSKIHSNNILQFFQNNSINSRSGLHYVGNEIYTGELNIFDEEDKDIEKLTTHSLDLEKLISVDPGAIYRVSLGFHPTHVVYDCKGETEDQTKFNDFVQNFDPEKPYAGTTYKDRRWNNRDNPCNIAFYLNDMSRHKTTMNVFASNLGLTVKKDSKNKMHAYVVNMVDNSLVSGAEVAVYSFQQQLLTKASTSDGTCVLDLPKDQEASFIIVSQGKDKMYMKVENGGALSISNFDVSGDRIQEGLKGFTYLDRGVRRPGDVIPVTFVLDDTENPIPNNHPVKFELYDPQGQLVDKKTLTSHVNHVYSTKFKTKKEDKTGNWRVSIHIGGAYFSKTIKVETVKPNRLKINTAFVDKDVLDISKSLKGSISSTWLHGAIAKGLKTDITVKLQSRHTSFKGFENYNFNHSYQRFSFEDKQIFNGTLDETGQVEFTHKFNIGNKAPGFLRANFITKVYEKGGDFSTNVISKDVSAYPAYVGVSIPKGQGYSNTLVTDKKHKINIVCLNEDSKPISKRKLKAKIYKIDWSWWWQSRRHGISNYINNSHHSEVYSKSITTDSKGKANFDFEIFQPEWGQFLVVVEDEKGGHVSSQTIYMDWPEWVGRSRGGPSNASNHLDFSTDKNTYKVGEIATVTIPSTKDGKILVSVENGFEVLETRWIDAKQGETKFELPVSEDMTPNVYIVINHLQQHKNTTNDLPMRLYGIHGIEVVNPKTKLEPQISMPNELRPEKEFELKVSETNGRPMTYTIQIVDDGLLDLTNYKTPNPWSTFYAKMALGVRTWDIYDDVIGAYGGTINQILAIGGDADLAGGKSKSANRFKPVAIHLGPFNLDAGDKETHKITLPNYVGSVRTMVIASDTKAQAYGNAENTTPVKKPLMVLASVPRKLTPTERFTLPVNVFVMDLSAKSVNVELKTNKAFKIIGPSKKSIKFKETGDQIVNFNVEVMGGTPIGQLDVFAKSGKEKAKYNVEIDVINPNLPITVLKNFELKPNESLKIPIETFGDIGSNTLDLEFSDFPSFNINGRLRNLIGYPYGCLEQTTSKAFPQLSLINIGDLSSTQKSKIDKHIKFAVNKLSNFQRANGGLSYWPHSNYYESWAEIFAGHFMLEAEKSGYRLPYGFKTKYINQLRNTARKNSSSSSRYNSLTQAYRLYVLALAEKADISSMNRLRESKYLNSTAKYRLAQAYALIGQKTIALTLIEEAGVKIEHEKYRYYRETFGSAIRDRAFNLETYVALDMNIEASKMAKSIAKDLNSEKWMSTQTTSIALRAMSAYAQKVNFDGLDFNYSLNDKDLGHIQKSKGSEMFTSELEQGKHHVLVKNNKNKPLFVSMVNGGLPIVGQEKSESRGLNVSISYKDMDGKIISVDSLKQGTNFYAELYISNTTSQSIHNVALSQIFPSGWEIINTRYTEGAITKNSEANFEDIRDDRVNYFMSLYGNKNKKFSVLLNASYLGEYYLPGAHAEAMYDNDYLVKKKGKMVKVIP